MTHLKIALLVVLLGLMSALGAPAQQTTDQRIDSLQQEVHLLKLEREVERLKSSKTSTASGGVVVFLFGAFCALWAQNTRRSALLWFFLGMFFNVVAVLVLLIKNSAERRPSDPRMFSEGRKIGT